MLQRLLPPPPTVDLVTCESTALSHVPPRHQRHPLHVQKVYLFFFYGSKGISYLRIEKTVYDATLYMLDGPSL